MINKKEKSNKKAKFFCEYCNSEVKDNSTYCQICGKYFISVKCPKCGQIGEQKLFSNGCPSCGYASNKTIEKKIIQKPMTVSNLAKKDDFNNDCLPMWLYAVIIGFLIGLLTFIFVYMI